MTSDPYLPAAPVKHTSPRQEVEEAFASISSLIKASLRPLPKETGDGSYITPPISTGLLEDLQKLHIKDVKSLIQTVKAQATGDPTDDRTCLMERIIQVAAELPATSTLGIELTDAFLNGLWNDLKHPPIASLGEAYKYRSADGSQNNVLFPKLGAANTPYARTVNPRTVQAAARPDPGALFDCLMSRKGFEPHPNQISNLFRTDHNNFNNSMTSSYLDLAPLYGSNQEEQNHMRTFQNGKIKADCFSEKRLLGFPPGTGVLLIMFNRFHNYVVEQLAVVNDSGRFNKPKDESVDAIAKYDNDLFQTGRLITCGLYVNCILKDYVRTILNVNQTNSTWDLDPRITENKTLLMQNPCPQGVGNQVSAEFNLVYRWHAAISERDDEWTQKEYRNLFPGRNPEDVGLHELLETLGKWEASLSDDPQQRSFANLTRATDGTLNDDALVEILTSSVKDVAGSFGANRVPTILRSVEILGIMQARSWNLATLNEFRAFFGLTKHETFLDINPDPEVATQLEHLYDHPDLVELYPGLVVEQAKVSMVPGSGLCPGMTVGRAVLSDAVALVRGDRFYTTDYTPQNLTSWGYNEVNYDVTVDGGHVFYKLFLRAFPNHFKGNSVYAHFPLTIPSANQVILTNLGKQDLYSFEEPLYVPPPTLITSYNAATLILGNKIDYKVTWGEAITFLMQNSGKLYGYDFMLAGDRPANASSRELMGQGIYKDGWHQEIKTFYEKITLELLRKKSYKLAGVNQVDIVRDVGNLAQTHFAAEIFCLPLKTEKNPRGIFAEEELYLIMALVFTCIFFDADPAKSFPLRQGSRAVTQQLGNIMQMMVEPMSLPGSGIMANIIDRFHQHSPLSHYGVHMIMQLLKSGLGVKDVVWSQILPTAGGMVANQAQLFAQCLDFYLADEQKSHLQKIHELALEDTERADDLILRYFMEGSRLSASVGLYREVETAADIQDGDSKVHLHKGQRIMVDCVTASHDSAGFPNPETVDLTRPLDSYIHYGWGPHICLGYDASKLAMTTMLKTVCKLKNLRRAPGLQGHIKQIKLPGGYTMYMLADGSSYWPFPTTMKVQWDGELPAVKSRL
ncbi:hypothetical protein MMC17_008399 [Xylographa soralifera]|nr:hypothetical protein [Xylographa soralifera]